MWRRGNDTVVSAIGRVRTGKQCGGFQMLAVSSPLMTAAASWRLSVFSQRGAVNLQPLSTSLSSGILPRTPHAARGLIGGDESGWLHRRSPGWLRLDRDGSRNRLRYDVQAVRHGADGPQVLRRGETERVRHAEAADVRVLEDAPAGGRSRSYRVE